MEGSVEPGAAAAALDLGDDFGPFEGRIWLNCSHQGPLPRTAAAAAQQAIAMKRAPHHLAEARPFEEVPRQLRAALGALIGVPGDDVILANSTSYGMTLFVHGINWKPGDEVLLVRGDFPATIYAWLPLAERGVSIRYIEPVGPSLTPGELADHITPRTRLFCTTWVHSFTGYAVDEAALAAVCREHGVLFVLNGSQGIGYRALDPIRSGIDALTCCGFKWLLGPYGTGFCWIRPSVRETLQSTKGYWLANLSADDLKGDFPVCLRDDLGARRFDIFGTANFFNFMTWTESVRYLLRIGLDRIGAHNQALVTRLLARINREAYTLSSPESGKARTAIVVLRCKLETRTREVFLALRRSKIDVALRRGALRVSPHVYNTVSDIDQLLEHLEASVTDQLR